MEFSDKLNIAMRGGDFKSKLTRPGSSVFLPGRQGRKRTSPEPLRVNSLRFMGGGRGL